MVITYVFFKTPFGTFLAAASPQGLCRLHAVEEKGKDATLKDISRYYPRASLREDSKPLKKILAEVEEYFAGRRRDFSVGLDTPGTLFQKKVWEALLAIPYGETRTYGQIAAAVGRPKAARAVGGACNQNPVAVIVPCHRVVGASGDLTGYAGGVEIKRRLLELERGRKLPGQT